MASKSNVEEAQTDTASEEPTRNWSELPSDLTFSILQRLGVVDRLQNAQLVCTAWREICKDPAMWRVVYMDKYTGGYGHLQCRHMCKLAVDRSQGQLLDLTIIGFCDNDLLQYVVDRSSLLRRLEIILDFGIFDETWNEAFKKLQLLEELSLFNIKFCEEHIEAAGRYCPLLKTLRLNKKPVEFRVVDDSFALAIAKNLPDQLTHLELNGNRMTNIGLQAILDGCYHLESLDLRRCWNIDLQGDLGKRCSQQIKHLKLPNDSYKGLPYYFAL